MGTQNYPIPYLLIAAGLSCAQALYFALNTYLLTLLPHGMAVLDQDE
jgi:hypothetical protein